MEKLLVKQIYREKEKYADYRRIYLWMDKNFKSF